jgi:hypothetical protein
MQQITIPGPISLVYDAIKDILIGIGYEEVKVSPPTLLDMKKNKTRLLSTDDIYYYHTIRILFKEINQNVEVDFVFTRYGIGQWSEESKKTFNEILKTIISKVPSHSTKRLPNLKEDEILIHREKIIERQIVKVRCRYCGTLNNDGQTKCESCGANL